MNEIEKSFEMVSQMTGPIHLGWATIVGELIDTMKLNLDGFVVRNYEIFDDKWKWTFGSVQWEQLHQPGTHGMWDDDPMKGRRDPVPLTEFLAYLHGWYWPRRKMMALDTAEPGIHLSAAREVA